MKCMAAPKNNSFWKARAKSGRGKIFSSPESLWAAACEYFDWCEKNPWYKNEAVKSGDLAGQIIAVPTARPYTLSGLCLFLGVDKITFDNYGQMEGYEDYFSVVTRIREVVYTQKFEGAAVGAYNANIIVRDLGLRDKADLDVRTPEGLSVTYRKQEGNDPL